MRVVLLSGDLIDDLVVDDADVCLERTADARYTLTISGAEAFGVELWTTRKQRIVVAPWDERPPGWATLEIAPDGLLQVFRATDCTVHLESIARGRYFLGVSQDALTWGLTLSAQGFLKARIIAS